MNATRESKERNLTWRIQEDNNCWTHLEHFLECISCILYVVSNLGKSGVQRFKWSMNWSWNEEVMAVWRQPCKAERQFRIRAPISQVVSQLRSHPLAHECHFAASYTHFAAAKWAAKWFRNWPQAANHVAKSPPSCEWSCESSPSCGIISKLWNHLQLAKPKIKLAKWTIQCVTHLAESTCALSDICNRLS